MQADLTNYVQNRIGKALFRIAFVFVLLFICSFSFPHEYILDIGHYTHSFFERMVAWVGNHILHIDKPYSTELISDSTGMYINVLVLLVISIAIALVWGLIDRPKNYSALKYWFIVFIRYYLAMQLLSYGWNKVFKWQFYLPEPNTLFTPLGYIHKDLLYWSAMGMSRSYSIFTGALEVLAALLLFFRKTQLIGALVALGVMVNVLMINIGFDISVKLYSSFLLLLCMMVIWPHTKRLYYLLLLRNPTEPGFPSFKYPSFKKPWLCRTIKFIVITLLLVDSLVIYFSSKNFNDDKAARPYMHGAYQVKTFVRNGDTLLPLATDVYRWRRMFIHRQGYLIVQSMDDSMKDYELYNDSLKHELILKNPEDSSLHVLQYRNMADTALQLNGRLYNDSLNIYLKKIDLQQLPLMKNEFNWTIDE
jgi:uncharacterized membrane protein YphA (DoxX/SURF4 family)